MTRTHTTLLALLLALSVPRVAAAIVNPSFEDDAASFFITGASPPTGWTAVAGGGALKGQVTDIAATDGTYGVQLFVSAAGTVGTAFPFELHQTVDLTGIDVIAFDAKLEQEDSTWDPSMVAEFRIDGGVEWSQNGEGFFTDTVVDVSGLSGNHDIEFRLAPTVNGSFPFHRFQFDNLRDTLPPPRLTSARVDPLVIRAGVDTFTMTVTCSIPLVEQIHIDLGSAVTQGGAPAGVVIFRDDGTQGDATPGDGIYTADDLGLASTPDAIGNHVLGVRDVDYTFAAMPTIATSEHLALALRYMDAGLPIPSTSDPASDVRAASYAVSIEFPTIGQFPDLMIDRQALAQRYYDLFPDDLDFLFIAHEYNRADFAGTFTLVRNDVAGTGQPIQDDSALYGSAGVLRGLITVYNGYLRSFEVLNHEMLHYWAVDLDPSLHLGSGHWGAIERPSSGFGVAGSNGAYDRLELVSGSTYRGVDYPETPYGVYSDLELYLMGLIAPGDVASPIDALIDPVFQSFDAPVCDPVCGTAYLYTASGIAQVTMADIETEQGVRSPAYPASPTDFTGRLVVAYDRLLTPTELAFYDYAMREYESASSAHDLTFAAATGDRATIALPEPGSAAGIVAGIAVVGLLRRRRLRPLRPRSLRR